MSSLILVNKTQKGLPELNTVHFLGVVLKNFVSYLFKSCKHFCSDMLFISL